MSFSLIGDTWHRDPRWMALAEARGRSGRAARRVAQQLRGALADMMCESAAGESAGAEGNGYLTRSQAVAVCADDPWMLDLLTKPILNTGPLVHQPGQKCAERNCIDDSDPWADGYEYRICSYNKRTPFTKEKKLKAAQARERKSSEFKAEAYARDGGCCRYCRSGPLNRKITVSTDRRKIPQFDHVDHKKLAGPNNANYVTGCASCNEYKGARTPEQADMVLLPPPTPEQREAWAEQGLQLFDRQSSTDVITDRPSTRPPPDHGQNHETDRGHERGGDDGQSHGPNQADGAEPCPETALDQHDHQQIRPVKGLRTGQDRSPAGGGPPSPNDGTFSPDPHDPAARAPSPRNARTHRRDRGDVNRQRPKPTPRPTQW